MPRLFFAGKTEDVGPAHTDDCESSSVVVVCNDFLWSLCAVLLCYWTNALFGQNKRMIIRERNVVVFQEDGEIVMYGSNKKCKKEEKKQTTF